jgi:hypothetical protein
MAEPSGMDHRIRNCILLLFFSGISGPAFAQVVLNGMVADSATMQALPNVNITLKNSLRGTVSNDKGYYIIETRENDTLIFSMVGYYTESFPVKEIQERMIVYMTQEAKTLAPVTINSSVLIPGLQKMTRESSWKNPTQDQRLLETPGFQGIQMFGPGYVSRGFISKHSKYEKERKKLDKVKEENKKARGYVDIVNDPEVKDKLMKEYGLTEEIYFHHLAVFNEKNKDIIYELEANEVTSLLFIFFEENARKK